MSQSTNSNYGYQQASAGCSQYNTLGAYNGSQCMRGIQPPVPTTNVSGFYIVPAYSAPGYNTLQHGGGSDGCGGTSSSAYFQIGQAYGYGAGNCNTQYMGSICQ